MSIHKKELLSLAESLNQTHGPIAISAASLIAVTKRMFHGRDQKQHPELRPLVRLQDACVRDWARRHGVATDQIDRAIAALAQAGATADAIDALPPEPSVSTAAIRSHFSFMRKHAMRTKATSGLWARLNAQSRASVAPTASDGGAAERKSVTRSTTPRRPRSGPGTLAND